MRINVLGPLQVLVDGTEVEVGRPQVRHMLALLALEQGRPLRTHELVEELWWGAAPPADEAAALRVVVSRARTLLGPHRDLLAAARGTYRLEAETDLELAAQPATALARAAAFLDAWRGRPLPSLPGSPQIDRARHRLAEARLHAASTVARDLLGHACFDAVVALASPLHQEHPGDEGLALVLSEALARSGRKGAALGVLAETTAALRRDHGIAPGEELLAHERRLLTGAVDLRPPVASARPRSNTFIGRRREQDLLAADCCGVTLVTGEAGIGKTTLLTQVAAALAVGGRPALAVSAPHYPQRPMELIADLVTALDPAADAGNRPARGPGQLVPGASTPLHSREQLLDDTATFIAEHGAGSTIIIDDAQWLDLGSAEVLARVAATSTTHLVLASRPVPGHGLRRLLETLTIDSDRDIALDRFSLAETSAFLEAILGPRGRKLAAEMHARSGGHPLFLSLLGDLTAEGATDDDGLPSSILVAAKHRIDALSRRAQRTLTIASVCTPFISVPALTASIPSTLADLEEAEREGLIALDRASGRATFTHALIAEASYELLAEGDRVTWHDHLGRVLESLDAEPTEVAEHAWRAAAYDPVRCAETALAAACAHAELYAWEEVLTWSGRGLDAALTAPAPLRAALLAERGRAQRRLSLDSLDALLAAADLAADLDQPDLYSDIVIELCSHGSTTQTATVHDQALCHLERALATAPSPPMRVRLLAAASALFSNTIRAERGRELYLEALETSAELDDETQMEVLLHAHLGLASPLDIDRRVSCAERLLQLAPDDPDAGWEAAFLRFGVATVRGERDHADRTIAELRRLTPLVRLRNRDLGYAFCEAAYHIHIGDLDEADRWTEQILQHGAGYSPSWLTIIYGGALLATRQAQGRLGDTHAFLQQITAEAGDDYATYRGIMAGTAAAAGDRETAHRCLTALAPDGFAAIATSDLPATFVLTMVADAAVLVEDRDAAAALVERLAPFEDRFAWNGVAPHRPVAAHLAQLHALLGADEEAARCRSAAERLEHRCRRRAPAA